jgi:hypothetical protein
MAMPDKTNISRTLEALQNLESGLPENQLIALAGVTSIAEDQLLIEILKSFFEGRPKTERLYLQRLITLLETRIVVWQTHLEVLRDNGGTEGVIK